MRKLFYLFLPLSLIATAALVQDELTVAKIKVAAEVLALDFLDDEEIELGLEDLSDVREDLREIAKADLPNDLSPAIVFNPVLRPEQLPADATVSGPASVPPAGVELPADRDDLAWYTIEQLASLIYHRKITSRELTEFCLDRLMKYDSRLHCVITLTAERARAQADKMDAELAAGNYRGYLHGIPYGGKDLLAAKDYKTTWGAAPYRAQVIDQDAAVIEQLEAAGAVLCAKLTLGALAWGDVWYGEMTRNPWDTSKGSSGSSAGSASAVAAGLLPFAIGTETLGSIVSPSTVCGTTGLRPTFGRVSRHGAMALSWTMDKIGPITRSAADAGLVLSAIAHYDPRDAHAIEAGFNYELPTGAPDRQFRLGYLQSVMDGGDYGFQDNDSVVLRQLRELGYELVPIELPAVPEIGFILSVEAAAAFETLTRSGDDDQLKRQIRNAWPNTFRTAHFVPAVAYVQANRLRRRLMEEMDAVFSEVDAYVNPSWSSSSLFITNLTGHPSITVPNGMREGTPTSITFTAKLFREQDLVNLAAAYQGVSEWEEVHPENF